MPAEHTYPGVYVEQGSSGVHTISGVATSVTAFIGRARRGPVERPVEVASQKEFERVFGALWNASAMSFAVRDFFANGGARAIVVRLFHSNTAEAINQVADAALAGSNGKEAKERAAAVLAGMPDAAPFAIDAATTAQAAIDALADSAEASEVAAAAERARLRIGDDARRIRIDTLSFVAASPGSWAAQLRLTIEPASAAGAELAANELGVQSAQLFDLTVTDVAGAGSSETYANVTLVDSTRRIDKVLAAGSNLIAWGGEDLDTGTPALPDFSRVHGDAVGEAYHALEAVAGDADAGPAHVQAARQAYAAALKSAQASVDDGGLLTAADFVQPHAALKGVGLYALDRTPADVAFNLLCIPPYNATSDVDPAVIAAAGAYCEQRRAMLILDAPTGWDSAAKARAALSADPDALGYRGANAAVYFPRLAMPSPVRELGSESFGPCGALAGVFARIDNGRGVWKSPAGTEASIVGATGLSATITDEQAGELNALGINCLRAFRTQPPLVWGARTLRGADAMADEYKYVAVRRTALFIEASVDRGLEWVVFEPNAEPTWAAVRLCVGAFMRALFRQGAFQGALERDAYFVRCDASSMTPSDISQGIVTITVGFAPLKPAEFVVIRLRKTTRDAG